MYFEQNKYHRSSLTLPLSLYLYFEQKKYHRSSLTTEAPVSIVGSVLEKRKVPNGWKWSVCILPGDNYNDNDSDDNDNNDNSNNDDKAHGFQWMEIVSLYSAW